MPIVETDRRGRTLLVTLNRPEHKNAITAAALDLFDAAIAGAADDGDLRAIVITGAGGTFSSGFDIELLSDLTTAKPRAGRVRLTLAKLQARFDQLNALSIPVVAAIEGACLGAGLELALACDLRVGGSSSTYGFPETRLGFVPDLGGTSRMTKLVGPAHAKEWIITARTYGAQRAHEIGLLHETCPAGQALDHAIRLADELAQRAPLAVAWAKRTIDRAVDLSLADALRMEQDAMTEILVSQDLQEGVASLFERRTPKFTGR
jgi:enoyl-CoA hydratase/carnithine racemase